MGGEGCGQGLFGFGKRCVRCDFLRGGGEAGGGLCEQNLSCGAPLVQGVRCLARVGVSGVEGRTVFKHGNRSAVTRCHFFAFPQAHLENSGTLLLEICGEIRVLSFEPPAG